MKSFVYCLLILSISLSAYSQKKRPGYFVLSNGDTVKGKIKLPLINPDTDYMLYNESGFVKNFNKSEILAYGYVKNDVQEDYIKFKLKQFIYGMPNHGFAKYIVKGKITLFEFYWNNGKNTGTELLFSTTPGELSILFPGSLLPGFTNKKNILKDLMADCPEAVEKIKGVIDMEKTIKLVEMYNSCNVNTN